MKDAVEVADKRVRIDTRLRLAGKWLRDEFGEQINVNVPRLTAARTTDTVGEAIVARLASNGLLFPAPSSLLFEFIDIITNANPGPE